MSDRAYEDGTPVYIYTWIDKVPGVVLDAVQNEQGNWIYRVDLLGDTIANNVPESKLCKRTIVEPPKYSKNEIVKFKNKEQELIGKIEIVDAYGTFEQDEEPSYDIYVSGNPGCLWKHVRESWVLGEEKEEIFEKSKEEALLKKEKAIVNMTNWELYVYEENYSLSGTADAHPDLGKHMYIANTSPFMAYQYEEEVLTYETQNTIYICPLKYMTVSPYPSVKPAYKEELTHRAENSDSILDKIIAASAKLAFEHIRDNGPGLYEKDYPFDLEHMDFSNDAFLTRIKDLQKIGQEEITQMEKEENKRLIDIAKTYEDCLYLEMSNAEQGCKAAYHIGECTGVIMPSVHRGMFQDSVLYIKSKESEDDCSFDFRYFPKFSGFFMESYHWSDNLKQVIIKNEDDVPLEFNKHRIQPEETKLFTPNTGKEGRIRPDKHIR